MEEANNSLIVYNSADIQRRIYSIRDVQVMLDVDLAAFYGTKTKVLNQAVKRNIDRFPSNFMFRLTKKEKDELVTNCDHLENLKFASALPFVFTEQGVAMLSAVLKSKTAVKMSVQIMSAFVAMRRFLVENAGVFQRLNKVELKQLETDKKVDQIFDAMQSKTLEPKQGIFYDGQIFDAYKFISSLIRKAEKSILLIDNYIDETVLDLFTKKKKNVIVTILTTNINKTLQLDEKKFNAQYPLITIKEFNKAHDRFIIIDDKDVYHFGASLKDLGKKWFAFSKMDTNTIPLLSNIKNLK